MWSWICLACCAPAAALLAWWEACLARRGGEPVIQRDLLRHRTFALGSLLTASTVAPGKHTIPQAGASSRVQDVLSCHPAFAESL